MIPETRQEPDFEDVRFPVSGEDTSIEDHLSVDDETSDQPITQ